QLTRRTLQWGRGWLPRKALSEPNGTTLYRNGFNGAAVGYRGRPTPGGSAQRPQDFASMGPRLVTAEGQPEAHPQQHHPRLQWGRCWLRRTASRMPTPSRTTPGFKGAAVGYRGRPPRHGATPQGGINASMGPRLVTAEGLCMSKRMTQPWLRFNGAAVGYRGR